MPMWRPCASLLQVLEDLCNRIQCRTLFATHFHELSTVAMQRLLHVRCLSMGVFLTPLGPVLTHKVADGVPSMLMATPMTMLVLMP